MEYLSIRLREVNTQHAVQDAQLAAQAAWLTADEDYAILTEFRRRAIAGDFPIKSENHGGLTHSYYVFDPYAVAVPPIFADATAGDRKYPANQPIPESVLAIMRVTTGLEVTQACAGSEIEFREKKTACDKCAAKKLACELEKLDSEAAKPRIQTSLSRPKDPKTTEPKRDPVTKSENHVPYTADRPDNLKDFADDTLDFNSEDDKDEFASAPP